MCPQLMKCAAGDIVSSLTRLKNHAPELTFFVSIFMKLSQINNIKSRKVATFQNCEIFSNYYFSYVRDVKATLSDGNNDYSNVTKFNEDYVEFRKDRKHKKRTKTKKLDFQRNRYKQMLKNNLIICLSRFWCVFTTLDFFSSYPVDTRRRFNIL